MHNNFKKDSFIKYFLYDWLCTKYWNQILLCFPLRMIKFSTRSLKRILNEKLQKSNLQINSPDDICPWTSYIYLIHFWLLLSSNHGDTVRNECQVVLRCRNVCTRRWWVSKGSASPRVWVPLHRGSLGVGLLQSLKNGPVVWPICMLACCHVVDPGWQFSPSPHSELGTKPLVIPYREGAGSVHFVPKPRSALWLSELDEGHFCSVHRPPTHRPTTVYAVWEEIWVGKQVDWEGICCPENTSGFFGGGQGCLFWASRAFCLVFCGEFCIPKDRPGCLPVSETSRRCSERIEASPACFREIISPHLVVQVASG